MALELDRFAYVNFFRLIIRDYIQPQGCWDTANKNAWTRLRNMDKNREPPWTEVARNRIMAEGESIIIPFHRNNS